MKKEKYKVNEKDICYIYAKIIYFEIILMQLCNYTLNQDLVL